MIILLVLAAVVVAAPIAAAFLVSVASLREDAGHSLAGKPPSWVARAARRLLRVPPRGPRSQPAPQVPEPRNADSEDRSDWLTSPQA